MGSGRRGTRPRVRTVTGPTDRVVVVGVGLAGLSAAMRLAAAGREVVVLEREPVPGGRAGRVELTGPAGTYRIDNGPTVLTMPDLIADCFDALGESMDDWLQLGPVSPLYRADFADGSALDVHADPAAMAAEIERVIGPDEAAGYLRYVEFVSALYRYEMRDFIDRNIDSPLGLVSANLARLAAVGGFRRMAPKVAQYLSDPRTQRVFSFQAMYAGLSPQQALALYAVIAYMDSVAGVYAPRGGMHAIPVAMAAAAQKHGVEIRYDATVTRVELDGDRAVAVHVTDAGSGETERVACDAVVLNPDLPVAYRDLLGFVPPRVRRLRYSPSAFLLLAGSSRQYPRLAHHNIHFGHAWDGVFDELIDQGSLMSDPSFLVSAPTVSDPSLAPDGHHVYYVFFPTPNLKAGIDWTTETALPRAGTGDLGEPWLRRVRRCHRGRAGRHAA